MSLFCDAYFFYQNIVSRADFWILLHLSINFGRIQIDIRVKFVSKNTIYFIASIIKRQDFDLLLHTQVPFLLPRELYTIHSLTFISPILVHNAFRRLLVLPLSFCIIEPIANFIIRQRNASSPPIVSALLFSRFQWATSWFSTQYDSSHCA